MKVLVIAEHDQQQLKLSSYATVSAALQITDKVDVMIAGYHCHTVAQAAAAIKAIQHVYCMDDAAYEHPLAETLVPLLQDVAAGYTHILAPATTFGRNFLPRLASKLGVEQISDVIQIEAADRFVRPIYAGSALIKVQSADPIKLLTVRPTAFAANGLSCSTGGSAPIIPLNKVYNTTRIVWIKVERQPSTRPELTSARVIIAGGRGLQSAENFYLLESIAEKLQGAVGASRGAVDAGFAPNDYQVGQTGKVVAPELYIAVGISGAIQHVAGMKDSKVIVAINNDPGAPIFQMADYGLVGDLFTILPELDNALSRICE